MPFVLLIVGILLVVVAIRNTQSQLGDQITKDFTGANNFFYWIASIFIIGAFGYVEELKVPSRMMLALVLIALVLSNQGFFNKFVEQLKQGSANPPPPGPSPPTASGLAGNAAGAAAGGSPGGPLGGIFGGGQQSNVAQTAVQAAPFILAAL